jgi:hypothetical protein
MYVHQLFVVLGGTVTLVRAANSWIVPGAEWRSTANVKIDAHGGMVIQDGDTFYWVGQAVSDRMLTHAMSRPRHEDLLTRCRGTTLPVFLQESLGLGPGQEPGGFYQVYVATQVGEAKWIVVGMLAGPPAPGSIYLME